MIGQLRARPVTALTVALLSTLTASAMTIGADTMWLVAMGDRMIEARRVIHGIPFAAAATEQWPNVPALAEILFSVVHRLGLVGIGLLHLVGSLAAWLVTSASVQTRSGRPGSPAASGARPGGRGPVRSSSVDRAAAVTVAMVVAGSLTVWGVIRLQTLSPLPFSALVLLLMRQSSRPSRAIWLAVPLIAVWGNLHGAVLLGVCVLGAYLLFARLRPEPWTAVGVGVSAILALGANPALLRTVSYYRGVFDNEAAHARTHLWAPIRLDHGFDLVLVVAAVLLLALAWLARPRLWEVVAVAGLLVATVTTARNGVWLLFLLAPIAGAGLARLIDRRQPARSSRPLSARFGVAVAVLLLVGVLPLTGLRPPRVTQTPQALIDQVTALAQGRVVLAPEPLVESLAVAGARVWAADPIDAFDRPVQRAYLAFLNGEGDTGLAVAGAEVIVVARDHPLAQSPPPDFRLVAGAQLPGDWVALERIT